jgi:autotransporter-associated beta strand protein
MASAAILAAGLSTAHAQDLYWDLNGSTAGVGNIGGFQDGNWDDDALNTVWNPVADGTGTVQAWADGNVAHFSAGTDATDGIITIPVPALPQNASGLVIEEGKIEFQGNNGSIVLGANPSRVNNGAILQMPSTGFSIFTIAAGQVMTLDGGTIRSKITGLGSGMWSGLGTIELTSNGGIMDAANGSGNAYSIMAYTGTINLAPATAAATLTMQSTGNTGFGNSELRLRNNNNFTTLDIKSGLLRVDGTGGTAQSLGALTGTVKVAGGAIANTNNGAALGTSISIISPATRTIELTGLGDTPDSMIVINAGLTIDGPITGAGSLMLNGWGRLDGGGAPNIIGSQGQTLNLRGTNSYAGATTLNFGTLVATNGAAIPDTSRVTISTQSLWGGNNGAATTTLNTAIFRTVNDETIGSLAGGNATRGEVNLSGVGVTLTTGADGTSSTYSGSITGTGDLAKTGAGTFTMDGVKSYTGDTSVLGGTLSTNSASLADLADVYLTTGSTFNLNFAGSDTIDSLFIDGASQAVGTWGGAGSGADNITALLSGTGILNVTTFVPPPGLLGDYNDDGIVDTADYIDWRKNEGSVVDMPNDGTPGPNLIDQSHYDLWAANYGNSGSGSGGGAAVPEPASLVLVLLGIAAACVNRRGR